MKFYLFLFMTIIFVHFSTNQSLSTPNHHSHPKHCSHLASSSRSGSAEEIQIIPQSDFSLTASFYLKFLRFKLRVDINFFYNRFGELDFEYTPDEKSLILYSKNFYSHEAAKQFLFSAVNNIAYQLINLFMKEASQSDLVSSIPNAFVLIALKNMIESSQAIVRRDEKLSTYTNRVYQVQIKYLLGGGLRKDQDVKLVAKLHSKQIVHRLQLLKYGVKGTFKLAQLENLIKFFSDFKEKAERQPRIYVERPVVEKNLNLKLTRTAENLYKTIRKNFSGPGLKVLLSKYKLRKDQKFDWLREIEKSKRKDVRKFAREEFLQLNIVESFENYAIPANGNLRMAK